MKNLLASILVALTVTNSSVSFAATTKPTDKGKTTTAAPTPVTVVQVLMSKLDVVVEKDAKAKTIIRLMDAAGNNLAIRQLTSNKTATRVRFDLEKLADGLYFVKVWNGQTTQVQKFELKTAAISLDAYQKLAIIQKSTIIQNVVIL